MLYPRSLSINLLFILLLHLPMKSHKTNTIPLRALISRTSWHFVNKRHNFTTNIRSAGWGESCFGSKGGRENTRTNSAPLRSGFSFVTSCRLLLSFLQGYQHPSLFFNMLQMISRIQKAKPLSKPNVTQRHCSFTNANKIFFTYR